MPFAIPTAPSPAVPSPAIPPLPYDPPSWSAPPLRTPAFEILKAGVLVETLRCSPQKHFLVVGRLPLCDIQLEHPSVSRYHAVVDFKSNGEAFMYDLKSSHGTRLNKQLVLPRTHVLIRAGDQIRFGESTRIFIFQGTEEEGQEGEEADEEGHDQIQSPLPSRSSRVTTASSQLPSQEDSGITWGFREDAIEEEEQEFDPANFVPDENAYYHKDPKKAFRNYMENRGLDAELEWEEEGPGHARIYTARIRLPIDTALAPIYASASSGKKRDAERLAALDACEKLDARGMLRNNVDVDSAVRRNQLKEMYGDDDSDEDNFYDRTERGVGKASKQKIKKGSKAGASVSNVETYDSLVAKKQELTPRIKELQEMIIHADKQEKTRENVEGDDELDSYMQQISTVTKGVSKSSLQKELQTLQKEDQRLERLIKITKPSDIFAKPVISTVKQSVTPRNDTITEPPKPKAVEEQSEKPSKLVNNAIIAGTSLTAATSSTIVPTSSDSMPPPPPPPPPPSSSSSPASKRKSSTGDTGLTEGRTIDEEEHPDQPARPKRRKPMIPMTREEYLQEADETEAVDTWVPPEEQSGDGKTSLNAKYGY